MMNIKKIKANVRNIIFICLEGLKFRRNKKIKEYNLNQ